MEIFTTMITPFDESGKVDYETCERYVDWYFNSGLSGIFAICQSSEIFFLSLEERLKINKVVYNRAKYLERTYGRKFTVVSSGHVADTIEEQIRELNAIWESGTDALILITNRLDINNEGDDVFIGNCEKIISALPDEVKLGFYECPYPYKRLVTDKILNYCLSTDKFYYMKDTCCDADVIRERCELLKGSKFKLLNANAQTFLDSMRSGGSGYCGIMCNFHPRLYSWLGENYDKDSTDVNLVQSYLCSFGFIENGLPYPLTAKYNMSLCGIPTNVTSRVRGSETLTEYGKSCVRQMKEASDYIEQTIAK